MCSIDGCERPVFVRGWCRSHYDRWYRHGSPVAGGPMRQRAKGVECSVDGCDRQARGRGLCGRHHYRFLAHGNPTAGRTSVGDPLRFVEQLLATAPQDDCIKWPYAENGNGYGMILIDARNRPAHRYICELVHGAPPTADHYAIHSCGKGHEGCVNPLHVHWGTPAENQADRIRHDTHSRGERNWQAKLTEADVWSIMAMEGQLPQSQIAALFGVSQTTVWGILRGREWRWVQRSVTKEQPAARGTM